MKVMMLNDTGIVPHIGCQAVSDAHVRLLAKLGHCIKYRYFVGQLTQYYNGNEQDSIRNVLADSILMKKITDVDAVIVNGEGTIHHGAGMHYMAILAVAQELGKKTLIVNAVYQDSIGFETVLRRLDDFCVRDALSSDYASKQGIKNRIVPDSFLAAKFDYLKEPYINLTNKIVVTDWHPSRDFDVGRTVRDYYYKNRDRCFFFPLLHGIHHTLWRQAPRVISSCDFVITGRHHGIYLSAIAQKPFVALPSNTFKVEGLIKMSGVPIPICSNSEELRKGVEFCHTNKEAFYEFFNFLKSHMPLTTFAALGVVEDESLQIEAALARLAIDISRDPTLRKPSLWSLVHVGKYNSLSSAEFTIFHPENIRLSSNGPDLEVSEPDYKLALQNVLRLVHKKVIFFGTGSTSKALYNFLRCNIDYCIDNNPKNINKNFLGLEIKSPRVLLDEDPEELAIIVASQYYSEIAQQLRDMGFMENIHFWNGFKLLGIIDSIFTKK